MVVAPVKPNTNKRMTWIQCSSPVDCEREHKCAQEVEYRRARGAGLSREDLIEVCMSAAGHCSMVAAAVDEAKEMKRLWFKMRRGKASRDEIKDLGNFLARLARYNEGEDGRRFWGIVEQVRAVIGKSSVDSRLKKNSYEWD